MHEEATSMSSVPSSVAVSTSHSQNGTATSIAVPVTDVELDSLQRENSVSDNVDLQVSYSSNSAGTYAQLYFAGYFPSRILLCYAKPV